MANMTISEAHQEAENQWRQELKRAMQCFEERRRDIDLTFQAAALLSGAGFEVSPISTWAPWNGFTLLVQREDLKRLHDVLGRLKLSGKSVADCKKRTICISLIAVNYPPVTIEYIKQMDRSAKCKIVSQQQ